MSPILLLLVMLLPGEETPQHRHARLMREAAQQFAPLLTSDAAREADLAERVHRELAATSAWSRWRDEISPHALAAAAVAGIALTTLAILSFLVARPTWHSNRA